MTTPDDRRRKKEIKDEDSPSKRYGYTKPTPMPPEKIYRRGKLGVGRHQPRKATTEAQENTPQLKWYKKTPYIRAAGITRKTLDAGIGVLKTNEAKKKCRV